MNVPRRILQFLQYRLSRRDVELALGGYIGRNSIVGQHSSIARFTVLHESRLGCCVHVANSCRISHTVLESHIQVMPECLLSRTQVGRYSYLAHRTTIHGSRVGRFCSIGPGVIIGPGTHPTDFVSTSPVFYSTARQCGTTFAMADGFAESSPVTLGNDVHVGANVFVLDGVKVGHGAILAAGAVVVKDVPNYAIVGGVPAKVLRTRFDDPTIARLLAVRWWDWDENQLREAQPYIAAPDTGRFLDWAEARAPGREARQGTL